MDSQEDTWLTGQLNGLENWPALLDNVRNEAAGTGDNEPEFEGMHSTLVMSRAFDDTVGIAPAGPSPTHSTELAQTVPTELAEIHILSPSTAQNIEEGQPRHREGPLPEMEPPLPAMLPHQQAQPGTDSAPMNAQSRDDQLVHLIYPLVSNLHATGASMTQMMDDQEITGIRRLHYERAERLMRLIIGPTGQPVSYHALRTSDAYLIGSVERLHESHLQMEHDLRIIHSANEMMKNLVEYRESAMRRMRDVDRDYATLVGDLATFVQSQTREDETGWYNDVRR